MLAVEDDDAAVALIASTAAQSDGAAMTQSQVVAAEVSGISYQEM